MQTELMLLDEKTIKDKMYYIRGQYVMIDSDLAKIYGYTTKAFNQQVQSCLLYTSPSPRDRG